MLERWRRHWFTPAPLADLAVARIIVVTIVAVLDHGGRARQVALAAPTFFQPIPFLHAVGLPEQPSPAVAGAVADVTFGLLVLAGLGLCARPALAGILVLQTVQEAWTNSLGKVTHATLPLLYVLGILALSPCDRALSVRALVRGRPAGSCSPDARWPIELAFVVLAGYYGKAGVAKLLDGGLAWADGSTLQFYLVANGQPPAMWLAARPALCRVLSAMVLAFELGAPLGTIRALRPFVLAGGLCFHLGTRWFLGISFWPVVALYPMFVPWTRLARRTGVARAQPSRGPAAVADASPAPPSQRRSSSSKKPES